MTIDIVATRITIDGVAIPPEVESETAQAGLHRSGPAAAQIGRVFRLTPVKASA